MTDKSIESELKEVHKKLEDIEKRQEMINKINDLERQRQQEMGKRPFHHKYEMM